MLAKLRVVLLNVGVLHKMHHDTNMNKGPLILTGCSFRTLFPPEDQQHPTASVGICEDKTKLTSIRFLHIMQMQVHNAGHMVPMDQPKASLEMLRRFTQGKLKESLPETMVLKAVM